MEALESSRSRASSGMHKESDGDVSADAPAIRQCSFSAKPRRTMPHEGFEGGGRATGEHRDEQGRHHEALLASDAPPISGWRRRREVGLALEQEGAGHQGHHEDGGEVPSARPGGSCRPSARGLEPLPEHRNQATSWEVMDAWKTEIGSRLRSTTIIGFSEKHLRNEPGPVPLKDITPSRLEVLLNAKSGELAPKSLDPLRAHVHRVFELALRAASSLAPTPPRPSRASRSRRSCRTPSRPRRSR